MINIMLACAGGLSTSLLVKNMEQVATKRKIEAKIWAVPEVNVIREYNKKACDILLLGPQIRYRYNEIKESFKDKIPVIMIDPLVYGMMDGEKMLDQVLTLLKENQ